jgi:ABC-type Na+ efflux pump permease subunit
MNWRSIRAIARKDLQEVRGNRMAWLPMLILPLIFCVFVPVLVLLSSSSFALPEDVTGVAQEIEQLRGIIAPEVLALGLSDGQLLAYYVLAIFLAPMFLMLPIMSASVIGSESFVGEKERKTIEALLYTPATDRELFVGKMIAAVLPALLISWGSFLLYTLILNTLGFPLFGRIWFPNTTWIALILWLVPAFALLGMLTTVFISARVNTFMEAYQTSGLLVLPVLLLIIGQVSGVFSLGTGAVFAIGAVIWLINAVLFWLALRLFSRRALFATK